MNIELELNQLLQSGDSMDSCVCLLRTYRREGGRQDDAYAALERLCGKFNDDEQVEDKVLELMDFVSGFCSAEQRIW